MFEQLNPLKKVFIILFMQKKRSFCTEGPILTDAGAGRLSNAGWEQARPSTGQGDKHPLTQGYVSAALMELLGSAPAI